jgi:hypothetical protein
MIKAIAFDSLEAFQAEDLRITTELNAEGIICENYALPIEKDGKFLMIIDEKFLKYFSVEQINNAVDYVPFFEEEIEITI